MITFKTLTNMATFGTIKGVSVMLMVDVEASYDRTFKLRMVDIADPKGWDYGANHTDCYAILNGTKSFDECFGDFIK